ncbi:MAG: SCO family protein [Pseudomonadota bacterium]
MKNRFRILAASSLAAMAALLSGCGQGGGDTAIPADSVIALSEQFTGEFDLIDKNGARVVDEDFNGKIMIVYFGFTQCPDVCPGDIGAMSAALNELGDDVKEVAPIFISVDPERDSPQALKDYFGFDDRLIPLTGARAAADAARQAFKVVAQKQVLPDSALEYTINHQRFYFVSDRKGQPKIAILGGASPQEIAAVLRRSLSQS